MSKIIELIFDLFVAMVILFLSVFLYVGLRTETIVISMDKESTSEFLTDIKKNAYITSEDYERYLERLSLTGNLYDIQFEHNYTVYEPEYRMRTLEEILAAQRAAYAGTNIYHYREVETYAPYVTDPIDNSGLTMNTETNAGILAAAVSTDADPNHVHTDDCYDGHIHKGSAGPFVIPHAHNEYCNLYTSALGYTMHCQDCGKDYPGWFSWYIREPSGVLTCTGIDLYRYKFCFYCNSSRTTQGEEIHNYAHTCGYDRDGNLDGYLDASPIGVIYDYQSQYAPESVGNATYHNGCYVYHVHKTTQKVYNNAVSISSTPQTETYFTMFRNGLINYCDVPRYFFLGIDSLGYQYPGFGVRYRTEYNAIDHSFIFYYEAYKNSQYGSYINSNPGFPPVLTEAQFINIYCNKYDFVSLWNRIGILGLLSPSSSDFCVNYSATDLIDLCDYTQFDQWYLTCGMDGNGHLACNQIITSIAPTNPIQAVYIGEELITTARATYADGSTGVILCSTNYRTDAAVKNTDVAISYTDIKGAVLTAHMTVTVVPRTRICANGHTYNLKPDGSDPGCPFCREYVESIRIQSPNTSTMTIAIGTTLQENGVILFVKYLDGRTESISSGYVDNLDNGYVGTKLITIGYKGATTSIMVTTVCKKMICDICGYVYDLSPDGSNPGCPMCISKTPVFTGNVLTYDNTDYTDVILDDLYEDGIYYCGLGDTFGVVIKNRKSTPARNILRKVFTSLPEQGLHIKQSVSIKEK